MNKTMQSDSFKRALHLSRLIPLGKKDEAKKQAVHRWCEAIKLALAEGRN